MLRSFHVFDLQGPLRKDLSETCRFTTENDPKKLKLVLLKLVLLGRSNYAVFIYKYLFLCTLKRRRHAALYRHRAAAHRGGYRRAREADIIMGMEKGSAVNELHIPFLKFIFLLEI